MLAWGQQHVGAGLAAVLNSTSPVFVVLALALAGRRPAGAQLAGMALGLAGVVLVVGPERAEPAALPGMLACLFGAALYAGAALYGRQLAGIGPLAAATGTMLWATAVLVPLALVVEHPLALRPSAAALGAVAMLAVACTGLALLIYFRLVVSLGPAGVASQSYLRAGVGLALGAAVLGERIAPAQLAGLALVLAGVALLTLPARAASGRGGPA